jgi:tetratricopeptide (TPR) repeat protein
MLRCILCGVVLLCAALTAVAEGPSDPGSWVGQRVMPKADCRPMLGDKQLPLETLPRPLFVVGASGPWLSVRSATTQPDEAFGMGGPRPSSDSTRVRADEVVRIADAEAYYTKFLSEHPKSAWAHAERGVVWEILRKYKKADEDYTAAIQLDPRNAKRYMTRGKFFARHWAMPEATDDFSKAIEIDPRDSDAFCWRGVTWEARRDLDKAANDYSQAIRLNPRNVEAYLARGAILGNRGDSDGAIKDFSEAIRVSPTFASAYYNRGSVWDSKGDSDKAIKDFDEAIRLNPRFSLAFCNRGTLWAKKGDLDRAIKDYGEAIRIDPKFRLAYVNRADAWRQKRRLDMVLKDLDKMILLNPNDVGSYDARASILASCPDAACRNGRQAVADATKSCELMEWSGAWQCDRLAAAYAELGDFDAAVKWQKKAIELDADRGGSLGKEFNERLALYRQHKPYREPLLDEAGQKAEELKAKTAVPPL